MNERADGYIPLEPSIDPIHEVQIEETTDAIGMKCNFLWVGFLEKKN